MRNWKKTIAHLYKWHNLDNERQKAMENFVKIFAPDCYSPILEDGATQAFIEGVAGDDENLKDDLGYIIYEAPMLSGPATITILDAEWDMKKIEDIVDYLTKVYSGK